VDGKFFIYLFALFFMQFIDGFIGSMQAHNRFQQWVSEHYQKVHSTPLSKSTKTTVKPRWMVRAAVNNQWFGLNNKILLPIKICYQ
jgi:hypothetical protein